MNRDAFEIEVLAISSILNELIWLRTKRSSAVVRRILEPPAGEADRHLRRIRERARGIRILRGGAGANILTGRSPAFHRLSPLPRHDSIWAKGTPMDGGEETERALLHESRATPECRSPVVIGRCSSSTSGRFERWDPASVGCSLTSLRRERRRSHTRTPARRLAVRANLGTVLANVARRSAALPLSLGFKAGSRGINQVIARRICPRSTCRSQHASFREMADVVRRERLANDDYLRSSRSDQVWRSIRWTG